MPRIRILDRLQATGNNRSISPSSGFPILAGPPHTTLPPPLRHRTYCPSPQRSPTAADPARRSPPPVPPRAAHEGGHRGNAMGSLSCPSSAWRCSNQQRMRAPRRRGGRRGGLHPHASTAAPRDETAPPWRYHGFAAWPPLLAASCGPSLLRLLPTPPQSTRWGQETTSDAPSWWARGLLRRVQRPPQVGAKPRVGVLEICPRANWIWSTSGLRWIWSIMV
jgi:hypothetical protein